METILQIVVDFNVVCIVHYDQMSHMVEICEILIPLRWQFKYIFSYRHFATCET